MSRISEDTHVFLIIQVELPKGNIDLRKVLSGIHSYKVQPVKETLDYRANKRGSSVPRKLEMLVWVKKEDYQPLANRLGKIRITPRIKVSRFAPL